MLYWKLFKYYVNWYLLGRFGNEKELYWAQGQEFSTFIDVGANHGLYSVGLRKKIDRIIAIEPLNANLGVLRCVTFFMGKKIKIFGFALSNTEEIKTLFCNEPGKKSTRSSLSAEQNSNDFVQEVITKTLDSFLPEPNNDDKNILIKIDVEGHELEVLRGGYEFLNSGATWIVEIDPVQNQLFDKVFALYGRAGYKCYYIPNNGCNLLENRDLHIVPGITNYIFSRMVH